MSKIIFASEIINLNKGKKQIKKEFFITQDH